MKKQNEMKLPESYVDMNAQETLSASGRGTDDLIGGDESLINLSIHELDDASLEGLELEIKNDLGPNLETQPKTSGMDKVMGLTMVIQSGTGLVSGMTQFIKSATKKY